jgi:uncharacterized membrane protein YkvA (DUF1232 family)
MKLPWKHVRTILREVPSQGKLAYCLLRDRRVPRAPKLALLTALALIASPIDFPAWVPIVGELDVLALGVLAVKTFVEACPEELVTEHRKAIARRESRWDDDRRTSITAARAGVVRLAENARSRLRPAG